MLIYLHMIETDENRSKFEIIYTAYKNLMLYQANQILGDTRDSEDVVHEACLKIIKILDKIDQPKCPQTRSLVVTVVERTAIDLYRSRKRKSVISLEEEWHLPAKESMETLDAKNDLAAAIAQLTPRYREVLLLRYDNGFSEAEVAELLSMSVANVHKTIQRAKKKLAEILKI